MSGPNMEYVKVVIDGVETSINSVSRIKDPVIQHTMMLEVVRSILDISAKLSMTVINEDIKEHEKNIADERMQHERIKEKDNNKSGDNTVSKIAHMEKDLNSKKEIIQVVDTINKKINFRLDILSKYIQGSMSKHEDDDDDDDDYSDEE